MPRIASRVGLLGRRLRSTSGEGAGRRSRGARSSISSREPTFPRRRTSSRPRARAPRRVHALRRACGSPVLREAIAEHLAQRGVRRIPSTSWSRREPSRTSSTVFSQLSRPVTKCWCPIRDSHLRVDGALLRATPIPVPPRLDQGSRSISTRSSGRSPADRMVVFNSPSNPTGAVVPKLTCGGWRARGAHDLWVMSDEIYRASATARCASIASLPGMLERTIWWTFLQGLRDDRMAAGMGLFPAALAPHAVRLVINSNTCTASFVQEAGIARCAGRRRSGCDGASSARGATRSSRAWRGSRRSLSRACRCLLRLSGRARASSRRPRSRIGCSRGSRRAARWSGLRSGGSGYLRLSFAASLENWKKRGPVLAPVARL